MDKVDLIRKLNWFYTLEQNQVELYMEQSKMVADEYLKRTLERISYIEQQHVDNIAGKIKDMGGKPTLLGDMMAPMTGKITGAVTGLSGVINLLKVDITLEEKAMKDYKDLILKSANDEELFNILWSNLIDEDLHTAWFANKLDEMETQVART